MVLTAGGSLATIIAFGISAGTLLAVGLGALVLAFVLDYDTAMDSVKSVVKGIGGTVGAIVGEVGEVVGTGISSFASGLSWLLPIGLLGLGTYLWLSNDSGEKVQLNIKGDSHVD